MKYSVSFVFVLMLALTASATTVEWNGSNGGLWHDAGNWTPAMVPTAADEVSIPSGLCVIDVGATASARNILILSGGSLLVRDMATLNVGNFNDDLSGIVVLGELANAGTINISNISTSSSNALFGQGMVVTGTASNINFGQLYIQDVDKSGIYLDGSGIFNNNYYLDISGMGDSGIETSNPSSATFNNNTNATINIMGTGSHGLNLETGAVFNHSGYSLSFSGTIGGAALRIKGSMTTANGTNLTVANANSHGIHLSNSGSFSNDGQLHVLSGVAMDGLRLEGSASFINESCSIFTTAKGIVQYSTASITNDGMLRSTYAGANTTYSSFVNNGVVEAHQGYFNDMTNNAVAILGQITGLWCIDMNVPDIFDLGPNAGNFGVANNRFYTDPSLSTIAGAYLPVTNEFDPNANAVGLQTFYCVINDQVNNCSQLFTIVFTQQLLPPSPTYYEDTDSDGYGNSAVSTQICSLTPPFGYADNPDDCDDTDPLERPGQIWFKDLDNDDYTDGDFLVQCLRPTGYKVLAELTAGGDCDDSDPLEFPGQVWYRDLDGDDYSNGTTLTQCLRPANYYLASELTATSGDCDDNNPNTYPGAPEICDGEDNDCDTNIDEGVCGPTCDDPRVIASLPYSFSGSTMVYGNEYGSTDACNSAWMGGDDFVFTYAATAGQIARIKLTNTGVPSGTIYYGHAVFVLNGCPDDPGTSCLYTATYSSTTNSPIWIETVHFQTAGTYYIIVDSHPNFHQWFNFTLDIDLPQGNICENAIVVGGLPYSYAGSTQFFGSDYNSGDACSSAWMGGNDFLFSFTPSSTQVGRLKLTNTGMPAGATWYAHAFFVLNGCPDQPSTSCLYSQYLSSPTNSPLYVETAIFNAGTTYYIVVASHPNFHQWFNFTLDIEAPQGNVCENAVNIGSLPFTATNQTTCLFGNDYNSTMACNSSYMDANDFVYHLTPTQSGVANITLSNLSNGFTGIFLLNGCPNAGGSTCASATNNGTGNYSLSGQMLMAGSTYYIVIASHSITSCFSYNLDVSFAPLPVELISFEVENRGDKQALLRWETASEMEFSHYEIERSEDGLTWGSIGQVAAKAGSGAAQYQFADDLLKIPARTNHLYYRLKMVDMDGSFEFSKVRGIRLDGVEARFTIHPNPTSGRVHLRSVLPIEGPVQLVLTDVSGRVLLVQMIDFQENESYFVNESHLPQAGLYFLKIIEKGVAVWHEKLLVTGE